MNQEQNKQFMIYRNGEIDKVYYLKLQARNLLVGIGHVAYAGLELAVNAMDELVQSAK